MEQNIVKLQISNEYIQGSGVSVGAVGSHDDVLLEMDFRPSAVWAGTTRRAIFANALGENRTVIVLTTNLLEEGQGEIYLVPVPQQAKDVAGECFLTVEGFVTDGSGKEIVRCVTEEARFRVLPSKLYTNDSAPVTPSQAEQLQAEIDSIKTTIVNAGISERNAKASEEAAAYSERNAKASEEAAAYSEQAAQSSKEFAQAFAARADASKDEAQRQAAAAANYAAAAERSRAAITDMSVSAEALPTGLASVQKSKDPDGTYHLHFGLPKGDTGSVGLRGPAGPQGVEGPQGVPGPRGINGVAVAASGTYAFNVNEDGHLILNYTGDTAPDFSINEEGHLILNL